MKVTNFLISLFALVSASLAAAEPLSARVTGRGGLAFGDAGIDIMAYAPGWSNLQVKAEWISVPEIGHGRFTIANGNGATVFRGRGVWSQGEGGVLHGHIEISCVAPAELQCLAVVANVPAEPPFGLGDGSAATFELPFADGCMARLAFTNSIPYHAQDSRRWGGKWTTRFGASAFGPKNYTPGDKLVWEMMLSAPEGLALALATPIEIAEGDGWARLDFKKDIAPGSALDFSGMGFQDAPAGNHGWLKAVGGHFEFEGLPGVEQRFYGVNLCFTANYPDHDMADRLVDRLVRSGYNALRVHHHDGAWADAHEGRRTKDEGRSADAPEGSGAEPPSVVDDDVDRLDYLLAKCFERGIYVTTDLYVSRKARWRDIGIDRDDTLNQNLYKTYVGVHDGGFANWCRWSRTFLEHVNPYTGRAYKDEPGLPLISLINEGILAMGWDGTGKATDPFVHKAWKEFGGEGDTPSPGSEDFNRFDAWLTRRIWERCSSFVRSLGCRALLSNDNNGKQHGEGEGCTPLYDYVDNHWYIDHPTFIDKPWSLPSKCGNDNLVKTDKPAIFHRGWAKDASKPYTISEWNIAYPGVYRGMGGILTGALAAEQEWDGLWRFAYSHSRDTFLDGPGKGGSGFFDCVSDPLITASDRASVCLFLGARKRSSDARSDEVRSTKYEVRSKSDENALILDKERGSMAIVTDGTCGGFAESGRIEAGPLSFEIAGRDGPAPQDDPGAPHSSLVTRHSSLRGGHDVPITLWVSSLDGAPIERSSRMLLVHLTDVQGEAAQFADDRRRILLRWGQAPLVAVGNALVELRFDERERRASYAGNDGALRANDGNDESGLAANDGKESVSSLPLAERPVIAPQAHVIAAESGSSLRGKAAPAVFALDTAGNRIGVVPSAWDPATGVLRFRVSTRDSEGNGRIYYEIMR